MTLAESKKTKMMKIDGRIDGGCLAKLWFRVCIFPGITIKRADNNGYIPFEFDGKVEEGEFIMGEIAETHREMNRHCRLVVNYYYV